MRKLKIAALAALGLTGIAMMPTTASSMPVFGIDPLVATGGALANPVENVAWVCGPYGCHHVPNRRAYYYGPPRGAYYYGRPRPRYGYYGYHHGYRRW